MNASTVNLRGKINAISMLNYGTGSTYTIIPPKRKKCVCQRLEGFEITY